MTAGPRSSATRSQGGAETGVEAFLAILGAALHAAAGGDTSESCAGGAVPADAVDAAFPPGTAKAEEEGGKPDVAGLPAPANAQPSVPMAALAVPAPPQGDGPAPAAAATRPGVPARSGEAADAAPPQPAEKPGPIGQAGFMLSPAGPPDAAGAAASASGPAAAGPAATPPESPAPQPAAPQDSAPLPVAAYQDTPDTGAGIRSGRPAMAPAGPGPESQPAANGSGSAPAPVVPEAAAAVVPAPVSRGTPAARAARGPAQEAQTPPAADAAPVAAPVAARRMAVPPEAAPPPTSGADPEAPAIVAAVTRGPASREATPEAPATHGVPAAASPHAPATAATATPAQAAPAAPPPPPHVQIARALEPFALDQRPGAPATLSVRLEPADLGQVEVRLEPARDGTLRVEIIAERPETMALLQRERHDLMRALDRAGLSTNDPPAFSTGSGAGGEAHRQPAQRRAQGHGTPASRGGGVPGIAAFHPAPAQPVHRVAGRIDLIA